MEEPRALQIEPGRLIGTGRTAEVYSLPGGKALKLYHAWWPLRKIEWEARVGRLVHAAGIGSPEVGEIVQTEGRFGLIYERIDGPSMLEVLLAGPARLEELAGLFAELHATMHGQRPENLPSQRTKFEVEIQRAPLSADLKAGIFSTLQTLPDGTALCHGDFHPENVLMPQDGPRIIDWENACTGSPLADVARTLLLMETAHLYLPEGQTEFRQAGIRRFNEAYLAQYLALAGADSRLIEGWRVPVAAVRLTEGIKGEEDYLLAVCCGSERSSTS